MRTLYFAAVVITFSMAALWNIAGHYVFVLWFFLLLSFFFFFPRLISPVAEWMSTILLHMVCRKPRLHDTTCCQSGCQTSCQSGCTTRFDSRLNEQRLFVQFQHGCQVGCQTRLTTDNRFDNRLYVCLHDTAGCQGLYRVNGALVQI